MLTWAKRVQVWVWEQLLLVMLVGAATVAQFLELHRGGLLTQRTGAAIFCAALMTIVAQKVRSIADRQAEGDALAGISAVTISCHRAQARWGFAAQTLALYTSIALASTIWHVLIALYVGLYSGVWRVLYREHVRAWRRS